MDLWHKMLFPARRVWLAVSARVKDRKNGLSILSIYILLLYLFFFLIFFFFLVSIKIELIEHRLVQSRMD